MKIAITGGTGFVGRNVARCLAEKGHELVLIARGLDLSDPAALKLPQARFVSADLSSVMCLVQALEGCEAVVHCAGINREAGEQTYARVHVQGTRNLVEAAKLAGVRKIILMSFLRARPECGSGYHESKWAAEEIIRQSGLDYTVLKCGVIYGQGDHMLDHLSHAFYTFPVFAFVGFADRGIRPNAVADVARITTACILDRALSRQTVSVLGPEELTLRGAVRRVARVVGRRPVMFPLPVAFHRLLAWLLERSMKVPLVSTAQVQMLQEGLAEPVLPCEPMPPELAPRLRFTEDQIRNGLPPPGPFTWKDLGCGSEAYSRSGPHHTKRVFFEMP